MKRGSFHYGHFCHACRKNIALNDQVFFVEEGSGRYFCNQECIQRYYEPVAEFYYKQHLAMRDIHDIPESDFSKYEKYISLCIDKPEEVWLDRGEEGEEHYYFIANFSNEGGKFTYVIMSFCLEKEPTYILLSFPTRDAKLVEEFRRGSKLDFREKEIDTKDGNLKKHAFYVPAVFDNRSKALEEEMLRYRKKNDIKVWDFEDHSFLLNETIENPDEAWELDSENESMMLTLISQHSEALHYVVICGLNKNEEENITTWCVLYHFPTDDTSLVEKYRRGVMRRGVGSLRFIH